MLPYLKRSNNQLTTGGALILKPCATITGVGLWCWSDRPRSWARRPTRISSPRSKTFRRKSPRSIDSSAFHQKQGVTSRTSKNKDDAFSVESLVKRGLEYAATH